MDDPRELTAQALARPWTYARAKLGKILHPKQVAVLKDLYQPGSRVVMRCGNEVGKTSSVAASAILHHCDILKGLVVSTAGVRRQVAHQLWPNLTLYQHLYPGWTFSGTSIKDAGGRERYLGFTAANQGTFQGFHDLDGPLMIIIDEAAAVADAPAILVIGENVRLAAGLDWLGALSGRLLNPDPLGKNRLSDAG